MKPNHDFKVRIQTTPKGKLWIVFDRKEPVALFNRKIKAMKFMERKTKESEQWTMKTKQ